MELLDTLDTQISHVHRSRLRPHVGPKPRIADRGPHRGAEPATEATRCATEPGTLEANRLGRGVPSSAAAHA